MDHVHRVFAALIVATCAPVALAAPAFAQTCECAPAGGYVVQADEPPPRLPEYDQPPIPAPGYYWTPGDWAWNNYDYYWVPGAWVEPPQPGLLWTPGYWAFVGGVYAFRPGYWGQACRILRRDRLRIWLFRRRLSRRPLGQRALLLQYDGE